MTRQWDKDGMADQEEISNIRTVRDVDIYRDTPLRYLGYANEFGEAFRSHIPRLIYFGSYAVASTYCLADSIDKGRRCYQQSSHLNSYLQKRKAAETAVEAAIWQGLASVIIPGFTINRICAASRFTLRRFVHRMPHGAQMWVTTVVGLSAIPIIIKPIDRFVSMLREFHV